MANATYIKPTPRTAQQARRLHTNDQIKQLTKLQVQAYVESFFKKIEENRDLLGIISPKSLQYNIERSFDPAIDPTQRKLQVARYFDKLGNILPAILIIDAGVQTIPQSIGKITGASFNSGYLAREFGIFRKIPITLVAATRDVESCDELSSLLTLLFNELRNIAGGSYITGNKEQGETWTIMFNNEPVNSGVISEESIEGEPVEKIFFTETPIEVFFEDVLAIQEALPNIQEAGGVVGDPDLRAVIKPVIVCPDTVSINGTMVVYVNYFQDHYRIILSDARVATLSYDMTLTPRMPGKTVLQIIDPKDPINPVIASKEITVIIL